MKTETARRTVMGGLGVMMLGAEPGEAQAAQRPTKIYGVYCGTDMKSYLCELTGRANIPVYRMLISGDLPPPSAESKEFHPSPFWGNALLIMAGELTVSVSSGTLRKSTALPGDKVIFIDTQGEGHASDHPGVLRAVNIRFKEPWTALKKMKGWPDDVVPAKEFGAPVNF